MQNFGARFPPEILLKRVAIDLVVGAAFDTIAEEGTEAVTLPGFQVFSESLHKAWPSVGAVSETSSRSPRFPETAKVAVPGSNA